MRYKILINNIDFGESERDDQLDFYALMVECFCFEGVITEKERITLTRRIQKKAGKIN